MGSQDYQVGAIADDGFWITDFEEFSYVEGVPIGEFEGSSINGFCRFPSVVIPAGATITAATIQLYYDSVQEGDDPRAIIYAVDEANPSAISSYGDGDGRAKTSASVAAALPTSGTWWTSPSLVAIIQELVDSYSYAGGAAMEFVFEGDVSYSGCVLFYDYDVDSTKAPKLHIEYTEASSDPEGSLIGGKLIRGGLLLHGVLGR